MSSRYRLKSHGESDFMDSPQFATKDMALVEIRKIAKSANQRTYLWDTFDHPHRCVGLATPDEWLPPTSICRTCKGARIMPKVYRECSDCDGLGVKLQAPRWKPG